ncbi:MAG: hypothetical protein J6C55_03270 [Oscillospiraceae bacterium]|nr:hypothetical protein [Oscillospiraceae bacterium]
MFDNFKKTNKKIFKYIVINIFLLISFSLSVFGLTKNKDDIYEIKTKEDLYKFADLVNSGESRANAKLINDIVVNKGEINEKTDAKKVLHWKCIGNNEKNPFLGTFDGAGHSISGIYSNYDLKNDGKNYVGLFGIVGDNKKYIYKENVAEKLDIKETDLVGVIKNLKLINSCFKCNCKSNQDCKNSGICSQNYGILENCSSQKLTVVTTNGKTLDSGGLCSDNFGIIKNCCCNQSKISTSNGEENLSGGICVNNVGKIINSCVKSAEVISKNLKYNNYAGGICSINFGIILNSYCSSSKIMSQGGKNVIDKSDSKYVFGNDTLLDNYSGGICAYCNGLEGFIKNCYSSFVNISSIGKNSDNISGGICGYYFLSSEFSMSNCYSTISKISALGGSMNYKGGICGVVEKISETNKSIFNCYYLKLINAELLGIGAIKTPDLEKESRYRYFDVKSDIKTQTKAVSIQEFKNGFVLKKLNSGGPCEGYEFKQNKSPNVDKTLEYLILIKK